MEKLRAYLDSERGRRRWIAREMGISPSALSMWKRVPIERCADIERLTGISKVELRPDVFSDKSGIGAAE